MRSLLEGTAVRIARLRTMCRYLFTGAKTTCADCGDPIGNAKAETASPAPFNNTIGYLIAVWRMAFTIRPTLRCGWCWLLHGRTTR